MTIRLAIFSAVALAVGLGIFSCSTDDDDDDDSGDNATDDDVFDDDGISLDTEIEQCLDAMTFIIDDCGYDLTPEDICMNPDRSADCWVACVEDWGTPTPCEIFADCAFVGCDGDSIDGLSPAISNGRWEPDPVEDDGTGAYISSLTFDYCDDGNLDGGRIYIWAAGTYGPFLAYDVYWNDIVDDFTQGMDCGQPATAAIPVDFTGALPYLDEACADVEVTDGSGNLSNKLENICVTLP